MLHFRLLRHQRPAPAARGLLRRSHQGQEISAPRFLQTKSLIEKDLGMDLGDLRDEDWEELLSELRLLVAASGYSEWDAAMAAHLDEAEIPENEAPSSQPTGVARLETYTKGFIGLLKTGTSAAAGERMERFRRLVEGAEDAVFHPERGRGVSLAAGSEAIDAMVHEMSGFLAAISERDSSAWTDPGSRG